MAQMPDALVSAAQLRAELALLAAEKERLLAPLRARVEVALGAVTGEVVAPHLDPAEIGALQGRIREAAEAGLNELLLLRFPARACSDRGQAVNNAEPHWPQTLPDPARRIHGAWAARGAPAGYALRAYIMDFPRGLPGDVGLFLNWRG